MRVNKLVSNQVPYSLPREGGNRNVPSQRHNIFGRSRADHVTPLYPQNLAFNFVDRWLSLII
jgi:hypothetical protein